jgi:hypothetical protein
MGIATEILDLRHHQFSSVSALLAALERLHDAPKEKHSLREFAAIELADMVLTNVAAHASEARHGQPTIHRARRVVTRSYRQSRRLGPEQLSNRIQSLVQRREIRRLS